MKKFWLFFLIIIFIFSVFEVDFTLSKPLPGAPTNFKACASGKSILLTWDHPGDPILTVKFKIEKYDYSTSSWKEIEVVSYPTKKYTYTATSSGTFTFRIKACTKLFTENCSSYTSSVSSYVMYNAPSNLKAVRIAGKYDVKLTWNAVNPIADNIVIYRRIKGGMFFLSIATLPETPTTTTYTDTGAEANTEYEYLIRTQRGCNYSDSSSVVSILTYPKGVSTLSGSFQGSTGNGYLSWTYTGSPINGFKLYKFIKISIPPYFLWSFQEEFPSTTHSKTITGLSSSYGAHTYMVKTFNTAGESFDNKTITIYNLKKPEGLTATALSSTSIRLTWSYIDPNATHIVVSKSSDGTTYTALGTYTTSVTSVIHLGLTPNTKYYYKIKAKRDLNESASSDPAFATTLPAGSPPAPPSDLAGSAINCSTVELNWQDNSSDEVSFKLERKTGAGAFTQIKTLSADVINYSDTTVSADTTYTYRIRAYNSYGNSVYSNEVTVTTPKCGTPPAAPSNLTLEVAGSAIIVTWQDNSDNEDGFKIERKEEGGVFAEVKTVPANVKIYEDIGLLEEKTYYYRVRAYNSFGSSAYSNEANATTLPEAAPPIAPSNLTGLAISCSEIKISWTDLSNNEEGFSIERKIEGGTFTQIATAPANTTIYSDAGLLQQTKYYYKIRAYNSSGNSLYSNEIMVETPPCAKPPDPPSNLTAVPASSTQVDLNWDDNSDNEDRFLIERKVEGGSFIEIKILSKDTTTYSDTAVLANTKYYYRVRAYNSFGYSTYSNEASVKTPAKETAKIVIRLYIGQTKYYVNDEEKQMDTAPIIKEGRTFLPIRYVAEAIGAEVGWDSKEQKVTITLGEKKIELWIGKNTAKVNEEYKLIDPANPNIMPFIMPPGRTMLPIRFISESLGCKVEWNPDLKEVKIIYPGD